MSNQATLEVINDEPFSINELFTYIKENITGLFLLVLSAFIVIFVDYISRINTIIFSGQNPIAFTNTTPDGIQLMKTSKSPKIRKFRKR
jgi:hypothetical protein